MTFLGVLLIVTGICAASLLVIAKLNKLYKEWRRLPHFVFAPGVVGGIFAVCGITDFKKAISPDGGNPDFPLVVNKDGTKLYGVPGTLAFAHDNHPRSSFCTQTDRDFEVLLAYEFVTNMQSDLLFTPFASEKYFSFSEQKRLFPQDKEPFAFIEEKKKQNCENDFRLRFVAWMEKYRRGFRYATIGCWIVGVVAFTVWGLTALARSIAKDDAKIVTMYLNTQTGDVQAFTSTQKRERFQLAWEHDNEESSFKIEKSRVNKMMYLGGGLSRACIQQRRGKSRCGTVDSSLHLKVGDESYLRILNLLAWENDPDESTTTDGIFLSKDDAMKLVATGKYTMVSE